MTEKEITSIALKLFAIYLLVQIVLAIPTVIASLVTTKEFLSPDLSVMWLWAAAAAAVIIGLATAVLLWRLASKALSTSPVVVKDNGVSRIEVSIFVALGLFLVVQSLVRISYISAGAYVQYVRTEPGEVALQTYVLLAAHVFQGLIGLSLVLRTDGWVSLLRRIRNAGLPGKNR